MLLQYVINGLIVGIPYALLAIGFALVYNTTKVFNIASASVQVFATYVYYFFSHSLDWAVGVSIAMAVMLSMLLSLLMEITVYRPLYRRNASSGLLMIASIGLMAIVNSLVTIALNNSVATPKHIHGEGLPIIATIDITAEQVVQLLVGGLALTLFLLFLKHTGWGRRFKAMGSDEGLFVSLGYDIFKTRTLAFLLSGFFIALAGCLFICGSGSVISKEVSLDYFVLALAAMIIGGTGNYGACLAGGVIVGIAKEVTVVKIGTWSLGGWLDVAIFGLLMLILFYRPQGLFGQKQRSI